MKKLSSDELGRKSPEEALSLERNPIVVVLDNVRSAHNVGSIFRTCDAFLIEELILCGITPIPPHREISKTALGSTRSVKWRHYKDTNETLKELKQVGYRITAIEHTDGSVDLNKVPSTETKTALVFGSEVHGIGKDALNLCDLAVEIPMFGSKHSFNVSVCAGIVLWEYWKNGIKEL